MSGTVHQASVYAPAGHRGRPGTESGLSGALSCTSIAWVHQLWRSAVFAGQGVLVSTVSSQVLVGREASRGN